MSAPTVIFCGLEPDQDPTLRQDAERLAAAPGSCILFTAERGEAVPLVHEGPTGPHLVRLPLSQAAAQADAWGLDPALVLPLLSQDGETVFARFAPRGLDEATLHALAPGTAFRGLRGVGPALPAAEAGLAARAASLLNWQRRHRHCPFCGAATQPELGGTKQRCTNSACAAEHFPRLEPVVMTLVTCGDACLLGRQARFPPGFFTGFAGFVEAGETFEAAARREVWEEAGVTLSSAHYVASQPWPFPHAITIGLLGEVDTGDAARPDGVEIEQVRWFSRREVAQMLTNANTPAEPRMPGPISMAHQLARHWLAG